jgi:predicted MFS family arabinose efflux permease
VANNSSVTVALPRLSTEIALYFGIAVATTLGHGGILVLPFEIGAMVDGLGLNVSQAGLLASAELVPFTAAQFVLALYGARLPLRRVAIVGTLLIVCASLVSAAVLSLTLFTVARIAAGLGFGLVYSVASIAGVRARDPERAYGLGLGSTTVVYGVLLSALPRGGVVVARFPEFLHAHSGVFIVVAGFALALLPLMRWIPATPMVALHASPTRGTRAIGSRTALLSITVMTLFSVAVFSVYIYIERRGRELGVDTKTIGTMLSMIYVASGLLGSGMAAALGQRWGITLPLVVGLSLLGLTCLGTALSTSPFELWVGVAVNSVVWFFLYGYLFGLSAALDPDGRLPAVFGAMYLMAAGLAATVGGFLLRLSSFAAIGWLALVLCLVAAMIAWFTLRHLTGYIISDCPSKSV